MSGSQPRNSVVRELPSTICVNALGLERSTKGAQESVVVVGAGDGIETEEVGKSKMVVCGLMGHGRSLKQPVEGYN